MLLVLVPYFVLWTISHELHQISQLGSFGAHVVALFIQHRPFDWPTKTIWDTPRLDIPSKASRSIEAHSFESIWMSL